MPVRWRANPVAVFRFDATQPVLVCLAPTALLFRSNVGFPSRSARRPKPLGAKQAKILTGECCCRQATFGLIISHHAKQRASVFTVTVARILMSRHDRRLSAALPPLIPQGLQLLLYRIPRMERRPRLSQKPKPAKKRLIMAHI